MAFFNKLKWILGILLIFILIIATNLIDKNNFISVRNSVVSIYEDRLIANDIIFEMLKTFQQKELALLVSDSLFFKNQNESVNANLDALISKFEKTNLTTEEANVFADLKRNVQSLRDSEIQFSNGGYNNPSQVNKYIAGLKNNLNDLSKIQLREGSRQMTISKAAIDAVELFTQIEIYILVFLAILIQVIVMYKPQEKA